MIPPTLACAPCPTAVLDATHAAAIRDSVVEFANTIARGLSEEGPVARLRYFEANPAFFMASHGKDVFPTNACADTFVRRLAERSRRSISSGWHFA